MGCTKSVEINNIDQFMTAVRPLDLLVFRGADTVSGCIMDCEDMASGISHVEVAISQEWCKDIKTHTDPDVLYSWGSTMSGKLSDGVYDAESGRAKFGVQIRPLRELVIAYASHPGANVGVCRLLDNPIEDTENCAELKKKISRAYKKYNNRAYNANPIALAAALFPSLRWLRDSTMFTLGKFNDANPWLFCSEFVAALYEEVGIITDMTDGVEDGKLLNPANVLPVDFIGGDKDADGIVIPICEIPPIWIKK